MAARRKAYTRTLGTHFQLPASDPYQNACFMADLLAGRIQATALVETRDGEGRRTNLEYDDPDG